MKKRKTYEISVIDKTYSKTISDETKFYTSDTALELVFELKETEYTFESAEIVLLNIDDRSLTTRPVSKSLNSFTYELDDDVISHYGDWHCQVRFEQGETYVSSPVKFRIENDLSNDRPPQLSDVQSWVSLKRYADSLAEELKQAVLSTEGIEDTFNENELERQNQFTSAEQSRQDTFETNESERNEAFESNETTRQTQELEREKAETTRQQAENQRQSTFETNESERQTTFETAEQERQTAELIRVENENERNLTSVDEFIKLQNAVGGRNLIKWNPDNELKTITKTDKYYVEIQELNKQVLLTPKETYTIHLDYKFIQGNGKFSIGRSNANGVYIAEAHITFGEGSHTFTYTAPDDLGTGIYLAFRFIRDDVSTNGQCTVKNLSVRKGDVGNIPWTKAPEAYTTVSKDYYYNHVKLMNDFKEKQTELAMDMLGTFKLVNLVPNSNFANGLGDWIDYQNRMTITQKDDYVEMTVNGNLARLEYSILDKPNDKWFMVGKIKSTSSQAGLGSSATRYIKYNKLNEWEIVTGYQNPIHNNFSILAGEIGSTTQIEYVMFFNLTSIFGAGNDPTKDAMEWIILENGYFNELIIRRDDIKQYEINQLRKAVLALGGTI